MLSIDHINIKNKTILIRVDFNVPIVDNKITDLSRIKSSINTIKYALNQNAGIILVSHLGDPIINSFTNHHIADPQTNNHTNLSLKIILPILEDLLQMPINFSDNLISRQPILVKPKEIVLCENIRFIAEEKTNDPDFAKYLASLADVIIMDAFACAHRKHASTYGILNYAKVAAAGFLLNTEIINLKQALFNPKRPIVAIIGGAKISTKINLIQSILKFTDYLIIGGAIANTCLLAKGYNIGNSLYGQNYMDLASELCLKPNILLPIDALILNKHNLVEEKNLNSINGSDSIMDIGHKTFELYKKIIKTANTIIWNGPIGKFEDPRFINGTKWLAELINNHKCFSLIGGGETRAALEQLKLNNFSYISTGGGAFLEFLEKRTLPMIELLKEKR